MKTFNVLLWHLRVFPAVVPRAAQDHAALALPMCAGKRPYDRDPIAPCVYELQIHPSS